MDIDDHRWPFLSVSENLRGVPRFRGGEGGWLVREEFRHAAFEAGQDIFAGDGVLLV